MLPRKDATQPMAPGTPEKREHESLRPGVRAVLASFVVATGPVVGHLGQTRPSADVATPLANVVPQRPERPRYDGVVENRKTHWRREVCRLVAQWCGGPGVAKALRRGAQRRAFLSDPTHTPGCHCPPKHGSWLTQVAWWFRVLARRCLTRGDCCSPQDFATRLEDYLDVYNTHQAHPYRWT